MGDSFLKENDKILSGTFSEVGKNMENWKIIDYKSTIEENVWKFFDLALPSGCSAGRRKTGQNRVILERLERLRMKFINTGPRLEFWKCMLSYGSTLSLREKKYCREPSQVVGKIWKKKKIFPMEENIWKIFDIEPHFGYSAGRRKTGANMTTF